MSDRKNNVCAALIVSAMVLSAPAWGQENVGEGSGDTGTTGEASQDADSDAEQAPAAGSVADYYGQLESMDLLDIETGSKTTLKRELGAAEALLHKGATIDAAIALYAIVESPRYEGFEDFVEYQNAEYYLGVALARSGAYDSALNYFLRALERGAGSMYFAPAHRSAIDVAIETRDYETVLGSLEAIKLSDPLPPEASGERSYLRARVAYAKRDFPAAEGELSRLGRKSRLFSSALYLRGVIRTRKGEFRDAAEALCEIADTPDDDKYTFVIDERYYTIKDLARLGLGRIAHEQGEYDDAYYHYFQIPDDSDSLPNALFEAAWSMYQKRDLDAARDLVDEFINNFSTSPLMPEARLLAGYIELADCQFTEAQKYYDNLVKELEPIVAEIDRIRKAPERRALLFNRALDRWRAERADPTTLLKIKTPRVADKVIGLLRLDPRYVRLHEAVQGVRRAAGEAPHVVRAWSGLAKRVGKTNVGQVARESTVEEEDAADANGLLEDVRRLRDDLRRAREEVRRGRRDNSLPKDAATAELERLQDLEGEIAKLENKAKAAAKEADSALEQAAATGLRPMLASDLRQARSLSDDARELRQRLADQANNLAKSSLDALYRDTRRVLDKAKLGKIDAIIGQKRRLDIEVQDLASGRFPAELRGRLWEQGLIGDDEEFWPFEGEYWADEYEGWR